MAALAAAVCFDRFDKSRFEKGDISVKKKWLAILLVVAVTAGAVFAWRVGYSTRKSNDNLPSLTAIAEMSESEVNSLLPGYKGIQLREVWGEPDSSEEGVDRWETGGFTLVVSYDNKDVVSVCGLKDQLSSPAGER